MCKGTLNLFIFASGMKGKRQLIKKNSKQIMQFMRFCIVGTLAAGIHYGIYYVLLRLGAGHNLAYATGYIISFVYNFIATSYFTFQSSPSWGRFVGFAGSHAVNFLLHMVHRTEVNIITGPGDNERFGQRIRSLFYL